MNCPSKSLQIPWDLVEGHKVAKPQEPIAAALLLCVLEACDHRLLCVCLHASSQQAAALGPGASAHCSSLRVSHAGGLGRVVTA